jgi:hypothetical protein
LHTQIWFGQNRREHSQLPIGIIGLRGGTGTAPANPLHRGRFQSRD